MTLSNLNYILESILYEKDWKKTKRQRKAKKKIQSKNKESNQNNSKPLEVESSSSKQLPAIINDKEVVVPTLITDEEFDQAFLNEISANVQTTNAAVNEIVNTEVGTDISDQKLLEVLTLINKCTELLVDKQKEIDKLKDENKELVDAYINDIIGTNNNVVKKVKEEKEKADREDKKPLKQQVWKVVKDVYNWAVGDILSAKLPQDLIKSIMYSNPLTAIVAENSDILTGIGKGIVKGAEKALNLTPQKESFKECKMKLQNIEQIVNGMSVFMPSGICAELWQDEEGNIIVKYGECSDTYTQDEFGHLVEDGIEYFNPINQEEQSLMMESKIDDLEILDQIRRTTPCPVTRQKAISLMDNAGLGVDVEEETKNLKKEADKIQKNEDYEGNTYQVLVGTEEDGLEVVSIEDSEEDAIYRADYEYEHSDLDEDTIVEVVWVENGETIYTRSDMDEDYEETKNYKRTRLESPKSCKPNSFRTKEVNKKGDKIVFCKDKKSGKLKPQSKLQKKDENLSHIRKELDSIVNSINEISDDLAIKADYKRRYDLSDEETKLLKDKKNKKEIKMDEDNLSDLTERLNSVINEISDELANTVFMKRRQNWDDANALEDEKFDNFVKARKRFKNADVIEDEEEFDAALENKKEAEIEWQDSVEDLDHAQNKFRNNIQLMVGREFRKAKTSKTESYKRRLKESYEDPYIVNIQTEENEWEQEVFKNPVDAVRYYDDVKDFQYKEILNLESEEVYNMEGEPIFDEYMDPEMYEYNQQFFEAFKDSMLTDINDLDFPKALADTVETTEDGEVLTLGKVADEVKNLKDEIKDDLKDIKDEIKDELKDIKDEITDTVEDELDDIEFLDDMDKEIKDIQDEMDVDDSEESEPEDKEPEDKNAEEPEDNEESEDNKESPQESEDDELDESIDIDKYLKVGQLEDLQKTKQAIDKAVQQGKDVEEVKAEIELNSDDEKEEQEAKEYAAEKLTEALFDTAKTCAIKLKK